MVSDGMDMESHGMDMESDGKKDNNSILRVALGLKVSGKRNQGQLTTTNLEKASGGGD